ncbi:MAG: hypothetical protein KAS93_08125 [Gammaproteobacteria bacterium]|nr:hypothetical protein [Gammaproteobacteria bacterium]
MGLGSWVNSFAALLEHTLAKGSDINTRVDGLGGNWDKLPAPHDDGTEGFFDPCAVGDAVELDQAASAGQVQRNEPSTGVDSGAADAYVVTMGITPVAYVTGLHVTFFATNSNTGASTVNIDGLGIVPMRIHPTNALHAGYITAGDFIDMVYMGSYFYITVVTPDGMTDVVNAAQNADDAAASAAEAAASSDHIDAVISEGDTFLTGGDDITVDTVPDTPLPGQTTFDINNTYGTPTVSAGEGSSVTRTGAGTPASPYDYEVAALPGRNFITNGNFLVNEHIKTSATKYGLDRWYNKYGITNFLRNSTLPEIYDIPCRYVAQVWGGPTVQEGEWVDSVESKKLVVGEKITLSWRWSTVVPDPSGDSQVILSTQSSTPDTWVSATETIIYSETSVVALAELATRRDVEITVTQDMRDHGFGVSFKTPTEGSAGDVYLYLANVQLEKGSIATPFEVRTYSEELALCQHYYQTVTKATMCRTYNYSALTSVVIINVQFPVTMRDVPTISAVGDVDDGSPFDFTTKVSYINGFWVGKELVPSGLYLDLNQWEADAEIY